MKDQMSQKRRFRRCYGMLLMILIVSLCTIMVFAATKKKATTVRLVKYDGDVTVTNSTKGEQTLKKDMRLYDGDLETTGEASYAWMSLDDTKACKLDENSESEIRKKGKKIELMLNSGSLYFDVEAPLAKEESLNIRTSTMVTGVRGTCGWIEVTDDWSTRVFLLTGKLECVVINPVDNGSQTIILEPGNYADFMVYDKEKTGSTESVGVETVSFTKDDIPGYVLAEIYGNTDLIEKIYKESGIDLRNLTKGEVDAAIQRDQEKHKTIIVNIEEKASDEILVVTKDPVWVSEKTDNADGQIVYLTMPQKAETVQKFLDSDTVRKVMLVPGNGDHNANTLKVDIDFSIPENKTLETEPDVYVEVLKNHEFVVNGTAILGSDLENFGKLIVKSSNTLIARCRIVNNGYFENTLTGHVVLKKTFYNNGEFVNAGVIEEDEMVFGDALIKLFGGSFTMSQGSITSSQFEMTIEVDQEANVTLNFLGGKILNKKKEAATLSVPEGSYTVGALGTDIAGITDTILGKEADMKKYNAASVFRRDEQFHLISLDEVESYPLVVAKVEHGTIIAPKRVEAGAKVTLTAIPDAGYELDSLTANLYNQKTKKTGEAVVVAGDNTFSMPNHDVIVGGKFAMIAQQTLESGFKIQVRNSTGGTVTASQNEAKPGDTITLTVRNSSGHELESLRIVNAEGKPVGITSDGDGYAFTMPESDVTITPVFRALDLNVVFYDEDGRTVLNHQTIPYGTAPTYSGTTPTKASDGSYSYSFAGWKTSTASYGARAALPALTEDTVFTAIYFGTQLAQSGPVIPPETFAVTWRNWDGEILKVDEAVVSGSIPRYDGPTPTKDATQQYSYDFAGWTSSTADYASGEALPPVTADITYTARISSTVRSYTVTWEDEDGEILEKDEHVPYGITPTFDGETPEKESDAQYNYTFSGWNNAPMPVTGDATYVATYNETTRTYTITWTDDAGQVIGTSENLPYGSTPSFTTTPTKTADAQYSYAFAGWEPAITTVTGNATYKAKFDSILNTYTITWVNEGTVLGTDTVAYGQTPSYGGETTPIKDADVQYSYNFNGWTPAIEAVTGNATYTATYDAITRSYDVKFVDHDGTTILDTHTYLYGTAVADMTIPADPAGYTENNVNYDFNGWTPAVGPVAGDVTYVATYVVHVTGVSLTEDGALYLKVGQQMSITANITPEEATNKNLTWESSDATLVSVTPGTEGTATLTALAKTDNTPVTITVTTEDGEFADGVTVIVTPVTVTWQNADGTVLTTEDYSFNQVPTYKGETPVQASTAALDFTFAGWEDMNAPAETQYANGTPLPALTDDVIFKAYYSESTRQYNITFVDEDGTTILKAATAYDYGTPAADIVKPESDPVKEDDADYHYAFKGWSPALAQVTTDQTYTATYDATQIIHVSTISLNETDITIYTDSDPYEIIATITPDAAENKNVRWSIPETDAGIASILTTTDNNRVNVQGLSNGDTTLTVTTEDGSKTASVTIHVRTHVEEVTLTSSSNTAILGRSDVTLTATIAPATASNKNVTWTVDDATVLELVDEETTANESGVAKATIVPRATGSTKITVTTVNGSHTADVTITVKGHTVTWVDDDDTVLFEQTNVADGTIPSYPGTAEPSKAQTAQYTYSFAGWKIGTQEYPKTGTTGLLGITGDTTIQAYYTPVIRQYNVTFVDEDGTSELKAATAYDYGTLGSAIVAPAASKTSSAEFDYTFTGWIVKGSDGSLKYMTNAELPAVTEDAIYQATYSRTTRSYAINFHYDGSDNTKIHTQQVAYGTVPVYDGTEPAKTATIEVSYIFAGWQDVDGTPGLSSVTGEKDYYATFGESGNTFDITYHLNAGTDASAKVENAVTSYVYGVGATLPTAVSVTRDGYEFGGWYATATPTANDPAITAIGTTESGVKEFYAKWTAKKNTLTLTKAGAGTFSQISVGSTITAGELDIDAGMDDPNESITHDYETDQTVYILASVYKGSVGAEVTEMTAPNSITIQDAAGNVITPTYANGFYSFTMPARACTVTVTTVNYQVNIDEVANGSVTTDHDNCAEAGDTVVLNIVDVVNGYEFSGFTFKNDANENVTIATTKVNDGQYTFTMPAYNVTVEPAFTLKTFTVTFFDEDGTTVLKEATTYEFGTPAADIATPDDPTKEDDADYHYTFNGWTPALAEVTTNQTYKATYTATAIIHVTGVSLDATEVEAVVGGDSVTVNAIIAPEAAENQNVTWSIPEADVAIASVDHDGLTAWVTGLANGETTLTVTTEDGNYTASVPVTVTTAVSGLTLDKTEDTVILGKTSTLTATIAPTTASNQSVNWRSSDTAVVDIIVTENSNTITLDPKGAGIATITATSAADSTITAQCAITVSGYTVTWVNDDNTTLTTQYDVAYDTVPSYPGVAAPTKEATAENTYTFAGWKIGNVSYPKDGTVEMPGIQGDTTIQAYYTVNDRKYNVTFVDEDGTSELKAATAYDYNTPGSAIVEPEAPTKASTDTLTYTFAGWTVAGSETVYETGHLPNVTDDVTYVAKYTEADRLYTVTFYDSEANGSTQLYQTTTTYQGVVEYAGEEPTREADDTYEYRFNGWKYNNLILISDLSNQPITEDVNFTADYLPISKGVFYYFTNDGEDATPVLHLSGQKEESTWYTLEGGVLDSSKYTNG
ncbi:MAG: Ig-like domain-containing protein, partial [Acetatifactor sp.]|nr:Ig-like domain-containing protein [Acetatifactor sp.]